MFPEPTRVDGEREKEKKYQGRKKFRLIQAHSGSNGYVSTTTDQLCKNVCSPLHLKYSVSVSDITVIIRVTLHLGNLKSV